MFVPWDAGFTILYKPCYKFCQCKLGIVVYVMWLALKKKKTTKTKQILGLLTKEIT